MIDTWTNILKVNSASKTFYIWQHLSTNLYEITDGEKPEMVIGYRDLATLLKAHNLVLTATERPKPSFITIVQKHHNMIKDRGSLGDTAVSAALDVLMNHWVDAVYRPHTHLQEVSVVIEKLREFRENVKKELDT